MIINSVYKNIYYAQTVFLTNFKKEVGSPFVSVFFVGLLCDYSVAYEPIKKIFTRIM